MNAKDSSRDRDQVPASIDTSDLALSSARRRAAGDVENPANEPIPEPWRHKHERKGTWLGAKIPKASHLAAIEALAELRADAEKALRQEVELARSGGEPWSRIGYAIGTTPEAARQRYGARS